MYRGCKYMKAKAGLLVTLASILLMGCASNAPTTSETGTESSSTSDESSALTGEVELLEDTTFKTGYHLKSTTTADGGLIVDYIDYDGAAETADRNVWNMAQWWTPFNFKDAPYSFENGEHVYRNESRELRVNTDTGLMTMGLDSWKEYQTRFGESRTDPSQTWSHYLIEQDFRKAVYLTNVSSVTLNLDFRINEATLFDEEHFNPTMHTAQFVLYLTIRNDKLNKFFWFGVPIYDYRGGGLNDHYNIDQGFEGSTNTLIYSMGKKHYLNYPQLELKKDYNINIDILPFITDAFLFGKNDPTFNYPLKDWEFEDCYINYMNFGWELPGSFKIESQFSNLSIKAQVL